MRENEFYCLRCRKRVSVKKDDICFKNIKNSKMVNNGKKAPVLFAECQKCDAKLIKFVKHKDSEKFENKFPKC